MDQVTEYEPGEEPLMRPEDHGNEYCCIAECQSPTAPMLWWCTRRLGHTERHEAGGMHGRVYASWED